MDVNTYTLNITCVTNTICCSWFAVHCTSMNNTNRLISSDNKGYASILFEQMMNPGALPGKVKI